MNPNIAIIGVCSSLASPSMHPDPLHKPYQPAPTVAHSDLPTATPADAETSGWRVPNQGEVVRTYWQWHTWTPRPQWRLTSYWTSDKLIHDGRASYRVPVSIKAWCKVLWPLIKKLWKGKDTK